MRRLIYITIFLCCFLCANAQQNIKFNGATFGTTVENFILGFPEKPYLQKSYDTDIFNSNICNGYECFMKLNAETWKCYIFSSRKTDRVFRTVCTIGYPSDLQTHMMLLVKTLEEKYGGHYEEPQSELGYIKSGYDKLKEMFALKYQIKNSSGQAIGEIRISCSPWKNAQNDGGCIELSYLDLNTSALATREYNAIMSNAL